jgi:hypothetical protein
MKVQHRLKLLKFQVDEDLMCMDIVSTYIYLIIIYQKIYKFFLNFFEKSTNLKHFFFHFFI